MGYNSAVPIEEIERRLTVAHGSNMKLLSYSAMTQPALLECKIHRHRFSGSLIYVLNGMGCPLCSDDNRAAANANHIRLKSQATYVAEVAAGTDTIRVTGTYINAYTKIDHYCTVCKQTSPISPKSMLAHFACTPCGKRASSRVLPKEYRLGRRWVEVHGSEPQALDWLVTQYAAKDIKVASDGCVPVIPYRYQKVVDGKHSGPPRDRNYYPDVYIPSKRLIIEVKSTWTFGIMRKEWYYELAAKARGVKAAGYKFHVVLTWAFGTIRLPVNWYEMNWRDCVRMIRKRYGLNAAGNRQV